MGLELARLLTGAGHVVVGTTTTPGRVAELAAVCAEVVVLRGSDRAAVARAVEGADAVVLTVGPRLARAVDAAAREAEYTDTLVTTARTAAAVHDRVVFASSGSVYGSGVSKDAAPSDGGGRAAPGDLVDADDGDGSSTGAGADGYESSTGAGADGDGHSTGAGAVLDESSPTTDSPDPSPRSYLAAERAVLSAPGGAVVRIPDVHGHPADLDYPARVRFAHSHLGGAVPFAADALLYRIDYRDAAAALAFVVTEGLTGVYNAYPDAETPPTNAEAFAAICDAEGLPRLTYRSQIRLPVVPVSSARLRAAGFRFGEDTR
ncbi:nucleoside-diphosphate-sugar epimerase [Nonomuraea soli]|uniref:Nucleoside-diphosphate-sugar epimerase n=1 Tax=Nonomuraea soli TaxID=1032476 RepID=A0A7W0CLV8_9ACTN|nr:nucleoside-diphosphate-sugar epimerase [Nonomuraea soli]